MRWLPRVESFCSSLESYHLLEFVWTSEDWSDVEFRSYVNSEHDVA